MCRTRPLVRARSRARNKMPFVVLFLLRTPGNRSFEKPTHARTTCKLTIFSRRRLRCAIPRQLAYLRKADRSMEFHPGWRFRGDRQGIRHKAEENSTPAPDLKKLQTIELKPNDRETRSAPYLPCPRP